MRIAICGSMKFHEEMTATKAALEVMGFDVVTPLQSDEETPIEALPDITEQEIITAKIEYDFIREHFRNIDESDAILVLNYEKNGITGYIGGNTFLEMGHAFGLGKKIFLLFDIPDMDYVTEMKAMQPVVLDGDLSKIS